MARDTRTPALIRRAVLLWLAMLALLACSLAAALLFEGPLATLVPLGMSLLTAAVVAVAFMELPGADAVSKIGAAVALAFLAVLFTLTFADDATRSHLAPGFGAGAESGD